MTQSLQDRLKQLPAEYSDFADIYDRELRPVLEQKEQARKAEWDRAKTHGVFALLGGVLVGGIGFWLMRSPIILVVAFILVAFVWGYSYSRIVAVTSQVKAFMITPMAARFGLSYQEHPGEDAHQRLLETRKLDVVPDWDRFTLQDELDGERNGIQFNFFEAHLEQRQTTTDSRGRVETRWVTSFDGQIWVMDAPKKFHGTTKVTRDAGWFNALGGIGKTYSRIVLEDPDFEKIFEVYGTDQVEARFLLTPDVMEALTGLERIFSGEKLKCAFHNNKIHLSVEGSDLFEPGSVLSAINDPNRVADLLEDFAHVFHLIDVLGTR